jgi:hypothetical protein
LPATHFWGILAVNMSETGKFLKGKLLLDGGVLRGSFFHHTVVLVCEHNAEGAFGLVLNRAAAFSWRAGAADRVELFACGQFHSRRECLSEFEPRPFTG